MAIKKWDNDIVVNKKPEWKNNSSWKEGLFEEIGFMKWGHIRNSPSQNKVYPIFRKIDKDQPFSPKNLKFQEYLGKNTNTPHTKKSEVICIAIDISERSIKIDESELIFKVDDAQKVFFATEDPWTELKQKYHEVIEDARGKSTDLFEKEMRNIMSDMGFEVVKISINPSPVTEPNPPPVIEPNLSPVTEPTPSPVIEPNLSLVTKPNPSPVTEPTPSPVIEPTPSPVTEPNPSPVTEPNPSPVTEPNLSPVTEPNPSPVTEPTPSPVTEPNPSPVTEPTPSPVTEPNPSPVTEPNPSPTRLTSRRLWQIVFLLFLTISITTVWHFTKDEDGDGVPDFFDRCPSTPIGTKVDSEGCSHLPIPILLEKKIHYARFNEQEGNPIDWAELAAGDRLELFPKDGYKISFKLSQQGYVYILQSGQYQNDASGKCYLLYPDSDSIRNPLQPGNYVIPGNPDKYFELDPNEASGEKTILFKASTEKNSSLEKSYQQILEQNQLRRVGKEEPFNQVETNECLPISNNKCQECVSTISLKYHLK